MTLILEEPPVSTARPLGKAEKQDIMSETKAILTKLKENAGGSLKEMISSERAASKFLVYACFGFKLMRAQFPRLTNGAWKTFVADNFPAEVRNAGVYLAIGNHFKYDERYLEFLDSMDYPTSPADRMIRSVGSQLSELGINTRHELIEQFRKSKPVPEIGGRGAVMPSTPNGDEPAAKAPEPGPIAESDKPAESQDEEQTICERLLDKLILSVATLTTARNAFNVLIARRPVTALNPVKVKLLKETLQAAQEILAQLPD
jgi:hypothetical protein